MYQEVGYVRMLEAITDIIQKHEEPADAADEIDEKFIQPILKERDELLEAYPRLTS